jgi:hypothetical protein
MMDYGIVDRNATSTQFNFRVRIAYERNARNAGQEAQDPEGKEESQV